MIVLCVVTLDFGFAVLGVWCLLTCVSALISGINCGSGYRWIWVGDCLLGWSLVVHFCVEKGGLQLTLNFVVLP